MGRRVGGWVGVQVGGWVGWWVGGWVSGGHRDFVHQSQDA